MKKFIILVVTLLASASIAWAGLWTATCTFGANDNLCIVDLGALGQSPKYSTVNIFLPAATGRSDTTLTVTLSHDNSTYYTAYVENGDTAIDTYPGDNTVNKVYGLTPAYGARYWKFTSGTDNVWDNAVIVLQGRY
jgi:hypothetical protein